MIKRIDKSILIEKSRAEVFSYISNLENLPNITNFSSIEILTGDGGVGSTFSATSKTLLSTRKAKFVVVKKGSPSLFAYRDTSQIYDNEIGFELKDGNGETQVTAYIQVDVSPLGNFFLGGINKNSEIELEKTLSKLKEVVETTKSAVPPPGPAPEQESEPEPELAELEIFSDDPKIEALFGKTPEEIADKFKKSNY